MLLVASGILFGQGTDLGIIRGTVSDKTGGVVPGATVEAVDTATDQARRATASGEGAYELPALKAGAYLVRVSSKGFRTLEVKGVLLKGGDVVRVDARLEVAATAESIVVEASAPLIQTESPTVSSSLDNRVLLEVPRDSRDIYNFLYLNPNITQGASGSGFKFLGAQSYGASFSMDGQRANGGIFGEPTASQPSLETIGELVVLSNTFTAEFAGIANIRVTTKRGESQYHGSLFYNNRNSALAAWALRNKVELANFTPSPARPDFKKPYSNLNEIGASFGGPLPKVKKTYFMTAFEQRISAQPVTLQSTSLSHPSLWAGDFTKLNDSAKPAVPAGVTLTAAEIGQYTLNGRGERLSRIPPRLMNPVSQALIEKYFPKISPDAPITASNGRVRYFQQFPGDVTRPLGTLRLDHDFTDNDKVYGVFSVQNANQRTSTVVNPYPGLGLTQNERQNYTLSVSYTKLIRPTLVNEIRGGFNRQDLLRRSNMTLRQFLASIGFDQSDIAAYQKVVGDQAIDTYGHTQISWGNFQNFGSGGRNTYRPMDQKLTTFGNTTNWIRGKHSLRFGGDVVRNAAVDGFANNRGVPRGSVSYTGGGVDAFTRWLMGLPGNSAGSVIALRPPMDVANWEAGFYAQDDWRITPRLTLNLGVRYELITPFVETNDLMVNFDPDAAGKSKDYPGRFIVPAERTLKNVDPRIISYGVVLAKDAGVGRGLVSLDKNNFAPRIGAAYRIGDKSVIRGGYGVFFPTSAAQGMRDALATNPFNQGRTVSNTAAAPLSPWPGFQHGFSPLTGGTPRAGGNLPSFNMIPTNLHSPRIQQYNVTFEYQLTPTMAVRASYLGTRMNDLIAGIDRNAIPASDLPFGTTTGDGVTACTPDDYDCEMSPADLARLPFPNLGDWMASYGNEGNGRSHAFQAEVSRRFSGGFTFNAVYTRLDQKTAILDTGNSTLGGVQYNQFNPDGDFGRDAFVSAHRFVAHGVWEVPFGKGRAWGKDLPAFAEHLAGGWQASWNMFAKSGTGFTPYMTCDNCSPAFPGNIASSMIDAVGDFSTGSAFRPLVIGDPYKTSGDRQWNPGAFAPPTVGADLFSNPQVAVRNFLNGPGTFGFNLGVHKVFRFGERVRAQLGADFNNVLNHPLLSPGDWSIGNLGSFLIDVDPKTKKVLPIKRFEPNPDFGRKINSYSQDGIDERRAVRLRLRITF